VILLVVGLVLLWLGLATIVYLPLVALGREEKQHMRGEIDAE